MLDKSFLSIVSGELFRDTAIVDWDAYFQRTMEYVNPIFAGQLGIRFTFTWTKITDEDCEDEGALFLCDHPRPEHLGLCEDTPFESIEEIRDMIIDRLNSFYEWIDAQNLTSSAGAHFLYTGCNYVLEVPDEANTEDQKVVSEEMKAKLRVIQKATYSNNGLAYLGRWCVAHKNVGIVTKRHLPTAKSLFLQALVFAHEVGHSLGMNHFGQDESGTCSGIMDYCGSKAGGVRRFVQENWDDNATYYLPKTQKTENRSGGLIDYSTCYGESTPIPDDCVLGNNICEASCNTPELEHDGGDCDTNSNGVFIDKDVCSPGCFTHQLGDRLCDPDCMVEACASWKNPSGRTELDDCLCWDLERITSCHLDVELDIAKCISYCGGPLFYYEKTWFKALAGAAVGVPILLCCLICCTGRKSPKKMTNRVAVDE